MSEILYENFRNDGRRPNNIRSITSRIGVHANSGDDGYVCLEQGNTKVIASIYGPHECRNHSEAKHDVAIISCKYSKCPTANFNAGRRYGKRDNISDLNADCVKSIMEKVIELHWYGESQIDINILVLQSDGSELAVVINAVSLALMDAGIRMKDFVTATTVGLFDQTILADLNGFEENQSSLPSLTMVLLPNSPSSERFTRMFPNNIDHISQVNTLYVAAESVCETVYKELNKQIKLYVASKLDKQHTIEGRSN